MAHTFSNHLFHIVFSTKERLPLIKDEQKAELHAYISGLIKEKNGRVLIINSMSDHVHILIVLPPDISVSDLLKFVKANSSRWMKRRFGIPFGWQKGFGSFTMSRSGVDAVAKYISDQEIHHKKWIIVTSLYAFSRKTRLISRKNSCGSEYAVVFDDSRGLLFSSPTSGDVGYTHSAVFDGSGGLYLLG